MSMNSKMRAIDKRMKDKLPVETESKRLLNIELSEMSEENLRLLVRYSGDEDLTKKESERVQKIFDDIEAKGINLSETLEHKLRMIEQRMKNMRYDSRVHFYNTHEEYMEAYNKNQINKKDISFIDDITKVD